MILTVDQLENLSPYADVLTENRRRDRTFSKGQKASVFLSHKHDELAYLKRVAYILEQYHANIYVDWMDSSMPRITSGDTAAKIKEKINTYDKFILVASDGAIESKWCNWELGYGDAQKFDAGKIALFPIAQNDGSWKGSEYMQLYPTIQYYDGTEKYTDGTPIPQGFYYFYKETDGKNHIKRLCNWLNS